MNQKGERGIMTKAGKQDIPTDLVGAETITIEALKKRSPEIFKIMEPWGKDSTIYYYVEDKIIDGDFEMDSYDENEILGFVFEKNLTVTGDIIQLEGDYGPHLLVMGNLKAKNLDKGGSYMDIYGDCDIDGLIYGYYNHGMLDIGGVTRAQYIIEDDHSMSFAKVDEDRLVAEIDMWNCNLSKLFLPELIENESRIDVEAARALLNEGKPILIDGWAIVDREEDDDDEEDEEDDDEAVSGMDYRECGLTMQPCEFDGQAHGLFLGLAVQDNRVVAVGGQGRTLMAYSEDGLHFQLRQMVSPGLRSACFSGEAIWVAGEYGFVAKSENGGESWEEILANQNECLFGIVEDESGALWIAGDDGYIACSKDRKKFKKLQGVEDGIGRISSSPLGILVPTDDPGYLYRVQKSKLTKTALEAGTNLMAAMVTGKGTLLVAGGDGGIFRSTDQGETFEPVETGTARMFTCIGQLPGGMLLAFGERGIVALSSDDGASFAMVAQDVCHETVWCCKNYQNSLLLGTGGGKIYRLQLG